MDISELGIVTSANLGAEMELLSPANGKPTGAVFIVLGYDADAITAAEREFSRKAIKSFNEDSSIEEIQEARRIALAEAAVIGWKDFYFKSKKPLEFSKTLLHEILTNPDFYWIVEQIQKFGGSRRNFFRERKDDS